MIGRLNLFGSNEIAREVSTLARATAHLKSVRPSTMALVGVLLTYGARSLRASQPKTLSRVKVCDPKGNFPVRIRQER